MSIRTAVMAAALAPVLFASPVNNDLKAGFEALDHGYVKAAEQLLSRAYDQLLREDPPDSEQLNSVRMGLASAYQFTGRTAEAERVSQALVDEWRRTRKQELLYSLISLSSIRAQQGKWNDARMITSEAVEYAEQHYGANDRTTRIVKAHLANLDLQCGRTAEAAVLLDKVLAASRANNGGPLEVAGILVSYAKVSIVQGELGRAVRIAREALETAVALPDQPMMEAESGYTLAAAYLHAGHIERAEPLVKAALAKYETAAGPDSASSTGGLMLAADIECAKRHFTAAASYQLRANDILRKAYGSADLEVAIGEAKLAEVYILDDKRREAVALLRHAVPILERMLAAPNARLGAAYRDLAELERANGSPVDAERYFQRAIAAFEECKYHGVSYVDTLQKYGDFLRRAHRSEAHDVLTRAKTMTRSLKGGSNVGLGY